MYPSSISSIPRRRFLRVSATLAAGPMIVPLSAIGAEHKPAPSERVAVGMIGMGRQAQKVNMQQFLKMKDVQIVAVCDVDSWRLSRAKEAIEAAYAKQAAKGSCYSCAACVEYRDLLARKDIDAVMISTPDHWHTPMAIAAAEAGKHVSLEKPITRSIGEGRRLADTFKRLGRVFRVDSEFRSIEHMLRAVELVRNGRLGKLTTIRSGVPAGDDVDCPYATGLSMPVPKELDWDRWQGPAPRAAYHEQRAHLPQNLDRAPWMRVLDYCDGMITNWGAHLNDIALWGANCERTGPVEIEGRGVYQRVGRMWNVLRTFEVTYRFGNGLQFIYKTEKPYVRFEGTEGWIQVDYPHGTTANPASVLNSNLGPNEVHFPLKSDKQDFIDAVKSGGRTLEDEEVGHRVTSLCHLGHISIHLGRKLRWEPHAERFPENDAANAYVDKPICNLSASAGG
jgi:myo-inositol 2-dehydrogenase / D-chiro-inositol 1-dehydrogenase